MMKKQTYFFIGINGIGMSGLAKLLVEQGHSVSGSDISKSLNQPFFKSLGINVFNKHDENHIKSTMIVVISSAIDDNNVELLSAKKKQCTIIKRGAMLAKLASHFDQCITIAGTHGKTTTTSLIIHIFSVANLTPSYFVGGHLNNIPHAKLDSTQIFITEVDESDGSFLDITPNNLIITNIELEHINFYKTRDTLIESFSTLTQNTLNNNGHCILNLDDSISEKIYKKLSNKQSIITFGIENKKSKIQAKNIEYNWKGSKFSLVINNCIVGEIQFGLIGKHNIYNVLSAIALCLSNNISLNDILNGIQEFPGVKRRLEVKYKANDIVLYDDYAHHPTEIITTLEGLYKSFSDQRIITLFQPHRFSRLTKFFDQFSTSFFRSSITLILPVYSAGESALDNKTSEDLVSSINQRGGSAIACRCFKTAYETIAPIIQPHDIILIMGAGDISLISKEIIPLIQRRTSLKKKQKSH